ncbi:MAG: Ribonuclease R [Candidatus Nomurabacteria bacterium GW2011_GWB1_37_5]|uniref:Ribonuclease R n=1 Tax=Candidatus Nomurabacteria bacterium GW2011_GWB1_37_5 TaxID=1618742 RepID=A0A0G0H184_9BACT|nr:MAG: Ribonuclease R [Candidatus Nomurabacteria bacterium GW2011_GWB1_37_5]
MKNNTKKEHKSTIKNEIEGVISISAKRVGYVRNKELKDSIEVDPAHLNTALQGDTVLVSINKKNQISSRSDLGTSRGPTSSRFDANEVQTGEVVKIIRRAKVGFSGHLEKEKDVNFFVPSDPKMYTDIIIPEKKLNHAKIGQKVFVKITDWNDPKKPPLGEVIQILGKPGDNNAEMIGIALEKGFAADFPDAVEKEAIKLKKEFEASLLEVKIRKTPGVGASLTPGVEENFRPRGDVEERDHGEGDLCRRQGLNL